jgi:hypothetical protein
MSVRMSKYSAVAPQMPELAFIGGVIIGDPDQTEQSEIPIHFNNKNRRRVFLVCLAGMTVITILTVALLIYAFAVAH